MTDHGHVCRSVDGSQAHEIIVEDDVENPVEAVFDAPVGANGSGELSGGQHRRREVIASGCAGFSGSGYTTFQAWRGSSIAEKCDLMEQTPPAAPAA